MFTLLILFGLQVYAKEPSDTCCPSPDSTHLPSLAHGAEWDTSNLFSFPNPDHACGLDTLDSQSGCVSQAAQPNASRLYCSADLVSFNIPNGFTRGCCSKIKKIEFNGQPILAKNGQPPSPFTTCQDGERCEMANNCVKDACNIFDHGPYNTSGVVGFGVNVFQQWLTLLNIQQEKAKAWLTFFGDGFEESDICHDPDLTTKTTKTKTTKISFIDSMHTMHTLPSIDKTVPFACARLVLSSFPISQCPQCGKHGACRCFGVQDYLEPLDFALGCECDNDDDWYGEFCSIHCEKNKGSWNHDLEKCMCKKNYYTEDCSVFCNHGAWIVHNGHGTCRCDDGYEGSSCSEIEKCTPHKTISSLLPVLQEKEKESNSNGCDNHGKCINSTCHCDVQYAGIFCRDKCPTCIHGYCNKNQTSDNVGKCSCASGWKGSVCDVSLCDFNPDISKKPCSGRGRCTSTGMCDCEKQYTGKVCDQCKQGHLLSPQCSTCLPGYTDTTSNCTRCDTKNHFVPDPVHPGLCVLVDPGSSGLSGTKLALVISVSFALGLLMFFLVRSVKNVMSPGSSSHTLSDFANNRDPSLGYVKLNSAMSNNSRNLSGSLLRQSRKNSPVPREPWDDDFLFDFNRLRLGRKIGGGTSGEVFLATWDDATTVAAKRLFTPTVGAAAFDRAFRREVSLLSQLHHPSIVQLLGVCESPNDGTCYIVTELCMGSLRDLIDDESYAISYTTALRVALQISSGMLYLHAKDVIHRDLKPGNVLVSNAENGTQEIQVKLCDFGLSRVKNTMSTLTAMTAAVGTPAYMAPELVRGTDMIDSVDAGKAVDVFSFGMMMLELFTRERPYINLQFNNSYHLLMRVCEGLRPELPMDGKIDRELGLLCQKCWHQIAKRRPDFEQVTLTLKLLERNEAAKRRRRGVEVNSGRENV